MGNAENNKKNKEPVRLNKYIASCGFCSRREADALIEAGRVTVDGRRAEVGQFVSPNERVEADGVRLKPKKRIIIIAYNKPVGVECTTAKDNPNNVIDKIGFPERIVPVGRLDKNSSGLLLLTNTGELSDKISRASSLAEKEYIVKTKEPAPDNALLRLSSGVKIEVPVRHFENERAFGKKYKTQLIYVTTRPCGVKRISENSFKITLTQGFNRQIRRMCEAVGVKVSSLKRVRVMNISLGDLKSGDYRLLSDKEIERLLKTLES